MKCTQDQTDSAEPAADSSLPKPQDSLIPFVESRSRPLRRTVRRQELHRMVPLADTTIYDMERRGDFPRRFNLTARCVVWDAAEVEAWLDARRKASDSAQLKRAPSPDVRQRRRRPIRSAPES